MATTNLWEYPRGYSMEIQQKPGSNWWFFRLDFSQIPLNANDVVKLCEIKNHWILKSGLTRAFLQSSDASSVDIGTSTGGNQIDNDAAVDNASDIWIRTDTLDDDGPIAITASDYLYLTMRDANCDSGIFDIMLEVIIPPTNVDDVDNYGS